MAAGSVRGATYMEKGRCMRGLTNQVLCRYFSVLHDRQGLH